MSYNAYTNNKPVHACAVQNNVRNEIDFWAIGRQNINLVQFTYFVSYVTRHYQQTFVDRQTGHTELGRQQKMSEELDRQKSSSSIYYNRIRCKKNSGRRNRVLSKIK